MTRLQTGPAAAVMIPSASVGVGWYSTEKGVTVGVRPTIRPAVAWASSCSRLLMIAASTNATAALANSPEREVTVSTYAAVRSRRATRGERR